MDFQRVPALYLGYSPSFHLPSGNMPTTMQLGANNSQIIYFESYEDKLGGLTLQCHHTYAIPFIDHSSEGHFVAKMPAEANPGRCHDAWQIGIT